MINKYIVLTILSFIIANILVWYQLNSQLVWDWAKGNKSMWIMTYFYLGETITLKTLISIILAIIIMLLQLL
jgi:hypothetical protein